MVEGLGGDDHLFGRSLPFPQFFFQLLLFFQGLAVHDVLDHVPAGAAHPVGQDDDELVGVFLVEVVGPKVPFEGDKVDDVVVQLFGVEVALFFLLFGLVALFFVVVVFFVEVPGHFQADDQGIDVGDQVVEVRRDFHHLDKDLAHVHRKGGKPLPGVFVFHSGAAVDQVAVGHGFDQTFEHVPVFPVGLFVPNQGGPGGGGVFFGVFVAQEDVDHVHEMHVHVRVVHVAVQEVRHPA